MRISIIFRKITHLGDFLVAEKALTLQQKYFIIQ
jgi:hypothetical protein